MTVSALLTSEERGERLDKEGHVGDLIFVIHSFSLE